MSKFYDNSTLNDDDLCLILGKLIIFIAIFSIYKQYLNINKSLKHTTM